MSVHADYAKFRIGLVGRILDEGLTPFQVATILGDAAQEFPQITYDECKLLRERGETWRLPNG
jgi:hypothetical protein